MAEAAPAPVTETPAAAPAPAAEAEAAAAPAPAAVAPAAAAAVGGVTATPYATASLYVGDLRLDVSESQLFDIFKNVGTVASIRVCRDTTTRRSLGYAYVNFHNTTDAERALDTMNYTLINGKPCRIMWSHRDPARRKAGSGNIFIKNLDKSVNNQQLYDTFSAFGNILSCKVETDDNGASKGFGYVHFEREEDAKSAVAKVDGMLLAGKKVFVGPFVSRRDRTQAADKEGIFTNVFVKNLDETITVEKLTEAFAKFGEITSAVVMKDAAGNTRGFGFVNYKEHGAASAAVAEMNNATVGSKQIVCCRAQKKAERERDLRKRFDGMKSEPMNNGVNVYIRNLDDSYGDEELRQLFAPFGTITSAKVMREEKREGQKEGTSKGFGFVCFSAPEEAHKAISEINGVLVANKPLYVALAQRKEYRRMQLEAQHRARSSAANMPQAYMPPVFYGGMPPQQQRMLFQQPPMMRQPGGWRGNPQVQPGGPHRNPYGGQQMGYGQPMMGPMGGRARQQGRPRPQMMPAIGKDGMPIPQQQGWAPQRGLKIAGRNQFHQQQQQQVAQQQVPVQAAVPVVPAVVAAPVPTEVAVAPAAEAVAMPDFNTMNPEEQRQAVGEQLFGIVYMAYPNDQQRCGKITGMLLESMDIPDLIKLLADQDALGKKIVEANTVLEAHAQKVAEAALDQAAAETK